MTSDSDFDVRTVDWSFAPAAWTVRYQPAVAEQTDPTYEAAETFDEDEPQPATASTAATTAKEEQMRRLRMGADTASESSEPR